MKLFPLIVSLGFFQLGYSAEPIEATSVSPKAQEFPQEYQADTECQNFLKPYTRLMKEGYYRLSEATKSVKEETSRRDLTEKEHTQILIKKMAILRYHINYLENIMGTIEASHCFNNIIFTQKINIAFVFAQTRSSLRDFSSKISKGLRELEQTPTSQGVYKLFTTIFSGDSYDTMDRDINSCLRAFEDYLENPSLIK